MGATTLAQVGRQKARPGISENLKLRLLRTAFWLVAASTGFIQIWLLDHIIWDDTVSYLDSADLLFRGDFANAITNHWSPGYPFLLGLAIRILHPVGLWEVAVVKLVDMICFLFAIACFDFFVSRLCNNLEREVEDLGSMLVVPKLALMSVGYLLFIWAILRLLPPWYSTPDMLTMGILFLILALLLKIKMGWTGFFSFILLGVLLGCGYLVKAPMFPLAFLFLGIAFLLVGDRKKAIPRVALSFGLFAVIAAPLVVELSVLAGSPTFGKSGAWNYARTVNGIILPFHWRGEPAGSGKPLHPTRVISQSPTVYEFGSPVLGTFPPWRDPYYWYAGIKPHFVLAGQWRVLKMNVKLLARLSSGLNESFVYGALLLLCMSSDRRLVGKILARQWFLLLPAIAALAMFSLVLVEDRYIAPYLIVIGIIMFSSVAVVRSANSLKLVHVAVMLAAALFAASSVKAAAEQLRSFAKSLHGNEILGRGDTWQFTNQAVSNALRAHGLQKGDKVAYLGEAGTFYWARLAGLQVNAEIRQWKLDATIHALASPAFLAGLEPSVDMYWASSPEVKQHIDLVLEKAGSKAIVSDDVPEGGLTDGWDPVHGTTFYIHPLTDHPVQSGSHPRSDK